MSDSPVTKTNSSRELSGRLIGGKRGASGEQANSVEPLSTTEPATAAESAVTKYSPELSALGRPGRTLRRAAPASSSSPLGQSRLGTAPLTALLPGLGELRLLSHFSNRISARYAQMLAGAQNSDDETSDRDLQSEESMLNQALQWLGVPSSESTQMERGSDPAALEAMRYTIDELAALYELGRLYFEMGYLAPAERIFGGLVAVDGASATASVLALALIRLERGLTLEAVSHFRRALESGTFSVETKLGLCIAFISTAEFGRAKSLLIEIGKDIEKAGSVATELSTIWEALSLSCPP